MTVIHELHNPIDVRTPKGTIYLLGQDEFCRVLYVVYVFLR